MGAANHLRRLILPPLRRRASPLQQRPCAFFIDRGHENPPVPPGGAHDRLLLQLAHLAIDDPGPWGSPGDRTWSSIGLRALFRIKATTEEKDVAINLMQVVAAYVGIMIAFSGVQVWQDYSTAKGAVSHEAATAAELYQDLSIYGPETRAARSDLRAYVESITQDEWPRLSQGRGVSRPRSRCSTSSMKLES